MTSLETAVRDALAYLDLPHLQHHPGMRHQVRKLRRALTDFQAERQRRLARLDDLQLTPDGAIALVKGEHEQRRVERADAAAGWDTVETEPDRQPIEDQPRHSYCTRCSDLGVRTR